MPAKTQANLAHLFQYCVPHFLPSACSDTREHHFLHIMLHQQRSPAREMGKVLQTLLTADHLLLYGSVHIPPFGRSCKPPQFQRSWKKSNLHQVGKKVVCCIMSPLGIKPLVLHRRQVSAVRCGKGHLFVCVIRIALFCSGSCFWHLPFYHSLQHTAAVFIHLACLQVPWSCRHSLVWPCQLQSRCLIYYLPGRLYRHCVRNHLDPGALHLPFTLCCCANC